MARPYHTETKRSDPVRRAIFFGELQESGLDIIWHYPLGEIVPEERETSCRCNRTPEVRFVTHRVARWKESATTNQSNA